MRHNRCEANLWFTICRIVYCEHHCILGDYPFVWWANLCVTAGGYMCQMTEGYFTAKVSANVYDTATGCHLLVPQGSTVLGHDQSSVLLYGNERLPTISLTLALPDGRSVDLGQAPVTDQLGVAGLTGRVNQHYWRLFVSGFFWGGLLGGTQGLPLPTGRAAGGGAEGAGDCAAGHPATPQPTRGG